MSCIFAHWQSLLRSGFGFQHIITSIHQSIHLWRWSLHFQSRSMVMVMDIDMIWIRDQHHWSDTAHRLFTLCIKLSVIDKCGVTAACISDIDIFSSSSLILLRLVFLFMVWACIRGGWMDRWGGMRSSRAFEISQNGFHYFLRERDERENHNCLY